MKKVIISVLITIILIFLFQRLVMPKYSSEIIEGSFVSDYYLEKLEHDVLFIGDCEVYESFSPIYIYENYGISSYIRGTPQQLIWQSYYLLEEMLKKEKPKVVVYNVLAMKYDKPQKEEYNRMTIDNMKWSVSKYNMIKSSMLSKERMIEYVFPILRFHDRITKLNKDDFNYYFKNKNFTHSGYYMRTDVLGVDDEYLKKLSELKANNYENKFFSKNVFYYLDKIRVLCEKNEIDLILIKAPSLYPFWYDEFEEEILSYSKKYNIEYINFLNNDIFEEVGIDYSKDTYDKGLHMNLYGAEKLSEYLSKYLIKKYNFKDRRQDLEYSKEWNLKILKYDKFKNQQLKEIKENNRIIMYD